jgi:hypothetical protein
MNLKLFKRLGILSILFFVSCSKGPGSTYIEMEEKVCAARSLSPMLEYTAPESQATVSTLVSIMDTSKGQTIMNKLDKNCTDKKIKIYKEEIDGDTAKIYLDKDSGPIKMRKVEGKWKLVFDKK